MEEIGSEALREYLGEFYFSIVDLAVQQLQGMFGEGRPGHNSALVASGNASNRILEPATRRKVPATVRPEIIVINDSD